MTYRSFRNVVLPEYHRFWCWTVWERILHKESLLIWGTSWGMKNTISFSWIL